MDFVWIYSMGAVMVPGMKTQERDMRRSVKSPELRSRGSRGFTLLELLVVMFIIALVIAIVLPALGHVKVVTKITATTAMMRDMSTATSDFELDNNRSPGYFSPREMGSAANAGQGFTAMENAMLELAGGVVQNGSGSSVIRVGPSLRTLVDVDLDLIGVDRAGAATYWMPDAKFYIPQDGDEGGVQEGSRAHSRLPDVVDAFGTPVLLWVEDDTAIGAIDSVEDFAQIASGGPDPSHFYWNSNAGFLRSKSLGKLRRDQTDATLGSRIGEDVSDNNRRESLAGILGHPAYPTPSDLSDGLNTLPGVARGKVIIHAAGPDGYYFGFSDKRGQGNSSGAIQYGLSFFNLSGDRHLDDNDVPEVDDVISGYDDIVETVGN